MAPDGASLFWKIVEICRSLACERDVPQLCERILTEAQHITQADGGTLYMYRNDGGNPRLEFFILRNDSLGLHRGGTSSTAIVLPSLPLYDEQGQQNLSNVATCAALQREIICVADAYDDARFDFSGVQAFDQRTGYHSKSFLTLPLQNHNDDLIGVLQLVNRLDDNGATTAFADELIPVIEALAAMVAVVLDTNILMQEHKDLLIGLAAEPTAARLFEHILEDAQQITNADGGTIYLLNDVNPEHPCLEFAIVRSLSLGFKLGGTAAERPSFAALPLYDADGRPNHRNVATYTALAKQTVNIADAYTAADFDFSGTKAFDRKHGYRSQSFLTLPLLNHEQDVIGVLQLLNARDPHTGRIVAFPTSCEAIVEALTSYAAIVLQNQILLEDHKKLLDAFVKCIAGAIDAKSPHTSNHCQKVPVITELLARAACEDQTDFADFSLDDNGWYELMTAAWLHDCGKLATPDSVLDKATKLDRIRDGIELVRTRYALLQRDAELAYLRKLAGGEHSPEALLEGWQSEQKQLTEELSFLESANQGGEFMSPADQDRVRELAKRRWCDARGLEQPLLSDDEVENLCIKRGTLTEAERQIINNHVSVSINMLGSLPFPKNLRRVPEYAGGHHERVDGSGFPQGLSGAQMSVPARIIAIADIFEALTAKDRPYKKAMGIKQALEIMRRMRDTGHIDPLLHDLFLRAGVWKTYAREHLDPAQFDL